MTLGERGSFVDDGENRVQYPSFKVEALDCTAAGDAFNAAFAVEYLKSEDVKKAVRFASAAAALAVQKKGAQPSMPLLEEVEAFLSANAGLS